MADSTYMNHGQRLIIAIDSENDKAQGLQWCPNESKAAYMALFSYIPVPDGLITDGLCSGRDGLRRRMTGRVDPRVGLVHDAGTATRWGKTLNAWRLRWGPSIAERTYARDNLKASKPE
ncbi:transposase [Bifidobacterium goeldii]|uniref:Transposase n=1 Tax=Bifidobacterium goeldii TaxID=2306975 RepID=A0A430FIW2_9BIFI|nr:transposase [Bifidobacterium goeldii]